MEKIYSKINGELLHQIVRLDDVVSGRTDLSTGDKTQENFFCMYGKWKNI